MRLLLGYAKIRQRIRQKLYILGFKANETFWITFHAEKHYFSTLLPSYWEFLLRMGHTDEEQAVKANFKRLQEVELHSIKGTLLSLRKC